MVKSERISSCKQFNNSFNKRISVFPKFIIILLALIGCIITINQVFNFGIFNFYPVSNSFLYLLIAFFQPIAFLIFPFSKSSKNKILISDIFAAISIFLIGIYFSINSENILSNGWDIDAPLLPTILSLMLIVLIIRVFKTDRWINYIFYSLIFFFIPNFC